LADAHRARDRRAHRGARAALPGGDPERRHPAGAAGRRAARARGGGPAAPPPTGSRPALPRTEMPSAVDDHIVVLVDDVVKTGRTIRAAMDALMDFGRPAAVQVVGVVDRGHRELPTKLDYVGKNVPSGAR